MKKNVSEIRGRDKISPLLKILMIMKISLILFLVAVTQMMASEIYSQNTKLTLQIKDATVRDVLNQIEDNSEFFFLYNSKLVDVNRIVSLSCKEEKINEILGKLFGKTDVVYAVVDRQIVLSNSPNVSNSVKPAEIQSKNVSGTVINKNGDAVPGVTVMIKGTSIGTVTDINGKYVLNNVPPGSTLVFSFIGMETREVEIGDQTQFNITMQESAIGLEEVVVIGYGTRARGALTGSVSTAKAEVFENRPVSNAIESLQGVLPGVIITKGSGRPGITPTLQIRGYSSINGNVPLVLVDGVPGRLDLINTNDIADISVLKDAAASIYGARAGDGVILVTTKKGQAGTPRVTYSVNYGISDPILPEMTNTLQYAEMIDEALMNAGAPRLNPQVFEKIRNNAPPDTLPGSGWNVFFEDYPAFYGSYNWHDIMYKPAGQQMHNLSISGGAENTGYMLSVGYNRNNGNFDFANHHFDRYNIRLNYDYRLFDRLSLETRTSFSNSIEEVPSNFQRIVNDIVYTLSYIPLYNPRGQFYQYEDFRNTADMAMNGGNTTNNNKFFEANVRASLDIVHGLKLVSQFGYILNPYSSRVLQRTFENHDWFGKVNTTRNLPNNATYVNSNGRNMLFNSYLNYTKLFAGSHNIDVMVGGAYETVHNERQSVQGYNFAGNNQIFTLNLIDRSNLAYLRNITGSESEWALASYFGRVSYSFMNKLFADVSLRSDGSSKFAPDKRWSALFPSFALAYNFAEDSYIKSGGFFDLLKLRVSWGKMGNQDIANLGLYDYLSTINMTAGVPMGSPNATVIAANPTITSASRTWEEITNSNAGLDMSILDSRLTFSFDYFLKTNSDMLVRLNTPQTFGGTPPTLNLGKLENRGFETSLGWSDQSGVFRYAIRLQLSDSKNKLVELRNTDTYREGLNRTREGYPLDSYFGYVSDGIIKTQEQLEAYKELGGDLPGEIGLGDLMYRDLDGDGKITAFGDASQGYFGDMQYLGNANPRYIYSSNIDLAFAGFDFRLFLQGVGKRNAAFMDPFALPIYYVYWQPLAFTYGTTWTPERSNATEPRLVPGGYLLDNVLAWNTKVSTHRIQSAAYMRVKVISLGYEIPSSVFRFLTDDRHLRIYVSGQDLFTFKTKALGGNYDPENGASAITNYPFTKVYSVGLDFKF